MNIKQVIVMRTTYPDGSGKTTGLRKGKMIAQGAHASLSFLTRRIQRIFEEQRSTKLFEKRGFDLWRYLDLTDNMRNWIEGEFAKVCVRVETEEELMQIHDRALEVGLEVHLITDSGRTEFGGVPTKTCLAIGPDDAEKIDLITGSLTLL